MSIKIGSFQIGGGRTFIIAEIGNNHNGDLDLALKMVDLARESGADSVKFQMRHIEEVYREASLAREGDDLGTEYVLDLLEKFELTLDEHQQVADYCRDAGIMYMCTPWDHKSAGKLHEFGVPAFKVASADLINIPFIRQLAEYNKPLILSTGMSNFEEIDFTRQIVEELDVPFVLLHCNSAYPAPLHDINLKWMARLAEIHPYIGYSGHERGISVSQAAVALGACVIERHFTVDRDMEGPDHAASLTPDEFRLMVTSIREIEAALGSGTSKVVSQGEMINRENLGKSLIAAMDIEAGTIITAEHVQIRSPGQGLSPQKLDDLIGTELGRDLEKGSFFFPSDLTSERPMAGSYNFRRPWGIPIRFHDFAKFDEMVTPDLFEFHLSYADMDLDPSDFLERNNEMDFVVHAPELFAESHLLDLATPDIDYRNRSINEMRRVIDLTIQLKSFFPSTTRPSIVTNIGGFSRDCPFEPDEIERRYGIFAESLELLKSDEVEIIPQTMAPFPWHFGGQRYQNLFVQSDEILERCRQFGLRICLDVSHSRLTCNHFGLDFYEFIRDVAQVTTHIHMGDARNVNGEGLQIGEGDIDFKLLCKTLDHHCPHASFIPEIWQGHKNSGEGFWIALERLNNLL